MPENAVEVLKQKIAARLESPDHARPGKLGAVNWKGALGKLDGFLQGNHMIISSLTPAQFDLFAEAIIQGVHLADDAVNPHQAVSPYPNVS